MKYAFLLLFGMPVLFSCNKSNTPTGQTQDTAVKSYSIYHPQTHVKGIELFSYNQSLQLAAIHAYSFDSTGQSPEVDSSVLTLTLIDASTPPAAYDITYYLAGDPPAGATDHHAVFYDVQNRVIRDSISSGANGQLTQHYLYDDNGHTTVEWLFPDANASSGYVVNQIDTFEIQSENILTDLNYTVNNGDDGSGHYGYLSEDFNRLNNFTYASDGNPLYQSALANSLGCLLVFNAAGDFRSKNLPVQFVSQEQGAGPATLNISWTTDGSGRPIRGTGTNSSSGLVEVIYEFAY